jgi:hypothetical protein
MSRFSSKFGGGRDKCILHTLITENRYGRTESPPIELLNLQSKPHIRQDCRKDVCER